jgi:hypothetical protein
LNCKKLQHSNSQHAPRNNQVGLRPLWTLTNCQTSDSIGAIKPTPCDTDSSWPQLHQPRLYNTQSSDNCMLLPLLTNDVVKHRPWHSCNSHIHRNLHNRSIRYGLQGLIIIITGFNRRCDATTPKAAMLAITQQ